MRMNHGRGRQVASPSCIEGTRYESDNMDELNQLKSARETIKAALGEDVMKRLHQEDWRLDLAGVAVYWGLVVVLFAMLASLPLGAVWFCCFVAQGFALQCLGLLSHDAFIHRKIWGDLGSWAGAIISFFPLMMRPTWYLVFHRDHHSYLGSEKDTETYKQNLDNIWKRVLFLTAIGDRLAKLGRLSQTDRPVPVILGRNSKERRRLKIEGVGLLIFVCLVGAAAFVWPREMLSGYILPLLVMTPAVSSLRVILEHAEADPGNSFHIATYYRCGAVTRALFLADAGDCHLVHHIFSQIPWYRMSEATRLMRPLLLKQGVAERNSLVQLLSGWFVRCYPHRSLWFRS